MTDSLSGTASFRFSEIPCPKKEKKKIAIEEDIDLWPLYIHVHTCIYTYIHTNTPNRIVTIRFGLAFLYSG